MGRAVKPVVHGVAPVYTANVHVETVLGGPTPLCELGQQPLFCHATSQANKRGPKVLNMVTHFIVEFWPSVKNQLTHSTCERTVCREETRARR